MKQASTALSAPRSRVPVSFIIGVTIAALAVLLVILEATGAASLARTIGLVASFVNGRRWVEWLEHLVFLSQIVAIGAVIVAAVRRASLEAFIPWVVVLISGVLFTRGSWAAALALALVVSVSVVTRHLERSKDRPDPSE